MSDALLADEIIARLNRLIQDEAVRNDVWRLMETRIVVSSGTAAHGSIQVQTDDANFPGSPAMGFLGLLNGIIGTIPTGKFRDWGFIAAVYDDDGKLVRFQRTGEPPPV